MGFRSRPLGKAVDRLLGSSEETPGRVGTAGMEINEDVERLVGSVNRV